MDRIYTVTSCQANLNCMCSGGQSVGRLASSGSSDPSWMECLVELTADWLHSHLGTLCARAVVSSAQCQRLMRSFVSKAGHHSTAAATNAEACRNYGADWSRCDLLRQVAFVQTIGPVLVVLSLWQARTFELNRIIMWRQPSIVSKRYLFRLQNASNSSNLT